ncbi:uncharacterized protein METZ01_LOCUS1806 [marine metagenome]|uniref:Uncharacterized protein n=1 Tax=marine metagenome TaxID=408172 RepID=A0A381N2W1_9ZZZZ
MVRQKRVQVFYETTSGPKVPHLALTTLLNKRI